MSIARWIAVSALVAAPLVGCSDAAEDALNDALNTDTGDSDTGRSADAGGGGLDVSVEDDSGTGGGGGGGIDGVECSRSGLTVAASQAQSDGSNVFYDAVSAENTPFDRISIQSLSDWNGPTTPGTYTLDGINYADCGLCLLAYSDCGDQACDKTFYAELGDVEITDIGFDDGLDFAGVLRDVVFEEVTIDSGTFRSTPVPGGETWCFGEFEFGATISQPQAAECDPNTYSCVGDEVRDVSFQSCETGEMVSLREMNAEADGTWMIMTAGWCSACHAYIPTVFQRLAEGGDMADANVNLMLILGEDDAGAPATYEFCQSYMTRYDHIASDFYIDPGYETVFGNIWIYPDASGVFGLPWQGIFQGGTNEFLYSDGNNQNIEDALTAIKQ